MKARVVWDQIGDLIELAGTYFADGAPRTAAEKLRQAAAIADRFADARDAALEPKP